MSYLTSERTGRGRTIFSTTLPMIVFGGIVLVLEWLLIRAVIAGVGILPDPIVFVATYGPILSAAGIGAVVSYVDRAKGNNSVWLPSIIAGIITVPLVISDPWIIIALGMGEAQAPAVLRLSLLVLPVIVAACFAHPRLANKRVDFRLLLLGVVLLAVYMVIYHLILPSGNLIGIR
ncbi:MAG: hypothetical protein M1335_02675 [Chloroflexi bacterium]|nr:hypothetical protein [Chloroflexota bacterium]